MKKRVVGIVVVVGAVVLAREFWTRAWTGTAAPTLTWGASLPRRIDVLPVMVQCPVILSTLRPNAVTARLPVGGGPARALALLEAAYEQRSDELLDQFLAHWASDVPPHTPREIARLPEVGRITYALYRDVYNEEGLQPVGGLAYHDWHADAKVVQRRQYVVIPPGVILEQRNDIAERVRHIDEIARSPESETVTHTGCLQPFRPPLDLDNRTALYLTPAYSAAITSFLDADAPYEEESRRREAFLNRRITVIGIHWGRGWHIATHPQFWNIAYNGARDVAVLSFQIEYSHCEAVLELRDGTWTIVKKGRCGYE